MSVFVLNEWQPLFEDEEDQHMCANCGGALNDDRFALSVVNDEDRPEPLVPPTINWESEFDKRYKQNPQPKKETQQQALVANDGRPAPLLPTPEIDWAKEASR